MVEWPAQPSLPPGLPYGYVTPPGFGDLNPFQSPFSSQQIEALRIKFQESLTQIIVLAVQGFLNAGEAAFDQLSSWATQISTAANDAADQLADLLDGILGTGHTISDLVDYFQNTAADATAALTDLATFLSATGQASIAALGAALNTLIGFLTSIPASLLSGMLPTGLQIGSATLSSLFNGTGQFIGVINSAATGALNTALTVGGTSLSTLFTNINSSGQLLLSGATGALNTAVTIGGTALSTLSTNWNGAVADVSNLLIGSGLANTALVGSNLAEIGTAITNAAAGTLGSLGAIATQVQTGFSDLLSGIFGGLTGTPAPANQTQAQVNEATQAVTTNIVGSAATFVGLQNAEAASANLMHYSVKFADYGGGLNPLGSDFTVSDDATLAPNTGGGIQVDEGRAVYEVVGSSGYAMKIARYDVAPTNTDYQEISWVHTGDFANLVGFTGYVGIYCRMNSAATSFLRVMIGPTAVDIDAVVAGVVTSNGSIGGLRPGARYTVKLGDLSNKRNIYIYENETLLTTFVDNVHQFGASYKYGGFGVSGNNTGALPNASHGVNVFSVADQVFKPGPFASAYVSTPETTTSTSFTDLTTTTDTVTATIGSSGAALVLVSAELQNNTQTSRSYMGFAVSGATTQAAAESYSISIGIAAAVANMGNHSGTFLVTGLNPGSNTFKAKYKVSATTGTFKDRRISVIPI